MIKEEKIIKISVWVAQNRPSVKSSGLLKMGACFFPHAISPRPVGLLLGTSCRRMYRARPYSTRLEWWPRWCGREDHGRETSLSRGDLRIAGHHYEVMIILGVKRKGEQTLRHQPAMPALPFCLFGRRCHHQARGVGRETCREKGNGRESCFVWRWAICASVSR